MVMRSHPDRYRLTFLLPAGITADAGSHAPSPEGCLLHVGDGLVVIVGPSREATFERATRFLRVVCRGRREAIAATLRMPDQLAGGDSWSIQVGADVAFSPTSLDPYFPKPESPHPQIELVGGRGR
jgi:hypothetical protein